MLLVFDEAVLAHPTHQQAHSRENINAVNGHPSEPIRDRQASHLLR